MVAVRPFAEKQRQREIVRTLNLAGKIRQCELILQMMMLQPTVRLVTLP